ncbi:cation acetate symporter, partial [bacterium]|nr:cation acetate symporter [bacterium]
MSVNTFLPALAAALLCAGSAFAAGDMGAADKQAINPTAIVMFMAFVGLTLAITYWAAKRTKSAA